MRRAILPTAALLLALPAVAAADELRFSPGESKALELAENPSTGYSWRIDRNASHGLDRVAITDEGHEPGPNLPGAPGTHRWRIRALKPGRTTIEFAYQRPWEPAPAERRRVLIEISR